LAYLEDGYFFSISAITSYEIFTGVKEGQKDFWNAFLEKVDVLSVDKEVVEIAVDVNNRLKKMRKQIDIADLFIAATAIMYDLPILTLNSNHFERIENLVVL
jgi:predicted nucleic acid-binding protein